MTRALATWGALLLPCLLLCVPAGGKAMNEPLTLEWSMTRSGNTLHISYTLRNNGPDKVYVLDQMVAARGQTYERLPQAVIVRGGDEAGTVDFIRGYVNPGHPVLFQYAPAARSVEPGKSIEGTAEVELPLTPWHPYGHLPPLKTPPQTAILEIGYVTGANLKWSKVPLKDGTDLSAPTLPTAVSQQHLVRSAPKPIPPK